MSSVCFDRSYFMIIILIVLAIVIYNHYMLLQENRNLKSSLQLSVDNKINSLNNANNTNNLVPINTPINPMPQVPPVPPIGQMIREYDRRTLDDPLTPPFKRDDYMIPSQMIRPDIYGVYTRGAPGVFKKMGYAKTDEVNADYKLLTLMGRQKYQGSTQYEYYVTSTNRDDNIKFYIDNIKRELFDGDKIRVKQLDNTQYTVFIDKELDLEYNPLLY